MGYQIDMCCFCLNSKTNVSYHLSDYYEKINTALPNLLLNNKYDDCLLCSECCDNIDTVYAFSNRCTENLKTFLDYKKALSLSNSKNCTSDVKLSDVKDIPDETMESTILYDTNGAVPNEFDSNVEAHKSSEPIYKVTLNEIDNKTNNMDIGRKHDIKMEETDTIDIDLNDTTGDTHTNELTPHMSEINNIDINFKVEELDIKIEPEINTTYLNEEGIDSLGDSGASYNTLTENLHVSEQMNNDATDWNVNNYEYHSNVKDEDNKVRRLLLDESIHLRTHKKPSSFDVCHKSTLSDLVNNKYETDKTPLQDTRSDEQSNRYLCSEQLTTSSALNKHSNFKEKDYECDVCFKVFAKSYYLARHRLIHTGEKPYKCDVCNRDFRRSYTLMKHKFTHTDEKPNKCDLCNKAFTRLDSLIAHKFIHTGEIPYKCEICNKGFTRADNLETHKLVHADVKPYKCDLCNKGFTHLRSLEKHKFTHTDEKPYTCDVCNKGFIRSDYLATHKLVHTGEMPYQCEVCSKRFIKASNYVAHKFTHTGEKPYKCDDCGKRFTTSSHLRRHKYTQVCEKQYNEMR